MSDVDSASTRHHFYRMCVAGQVRIRTETGLVTVAEMLALYLVDCARTLHRLKGSMTKAWALPTGDRSRRPTEGGTNGRSRHGGDRGRSTPRNDAGSA